MAMVDIQWNPTARQLRQFGLIALVGLPLAGWLFSGRPWPADMTTTQQYVIAGLAVLGVVFAVLAVVQPMVLRIPFLVATLIALPIGFFVGEVILLVMYFALFLPVALIFRLMGRDALARRIDRKAPSYWEAKTQPSGPESYFRQS